MFKLGRNLAEFPLKISIYQHPLVSIKAVGNLFFIISFNHAVLLGLAYLGIFLAPISFNSITIIYMILFGTIVFTVFIFSQNNIHKMMVKAKDEKINTFSKYIENLLDEVIINPTNEIIDRLEKLYSIQEKLNKMSVWPFDIRALLTIITTILLPIVLVLIQMILK